MMDRDTTTRPGTRAPVVGRHGRPNGGARARNASGTVRRIAVCKRRARGVDANIAAGRVDVVREGPT
jgi:hypothetical protein